MEPDAVTPPAAPLLPKQKSSYGALIAIIVILAMVVIGALYTWGARISEEPQPLPQATTTAQ